MGDNELRIPLETSLVNLYSHWDYEYTLTCDSHDKYVWICNVLHRLFHNESWWPIHNEWIGVRKICDTSLTLSSCWTQARWIWVVRDRKWGRTLHWLLFGTCQWCAYSRQCKLFTCSQRIFTAKDSNDCTRLLGLVTQSSHCLAAGPDKRPDFLLNIELFFTIYNLVLTHTQALTVPGFLSCTSTLSSVQPSAVEAALLI